MFFKNVNDYNQVLRIVVEALKNKPQVVRILPLAGRSISFEVKSLDGVMSTVADALFSSPVRIVDVITS